MIKREKRNDFFNTTASRTDSLVLSVVGRFLGSERLQAELIVQPVRKTWLQ